VHAYCVEWIVDTDVGQRGTGVGQDLAAIVDGPESENELFWSEAFGNDQFVACHGIANNTGYDSHASPLALPNEDLSLFGGFVPNVLVSNALFDKKIISAMLCKKLAGGSEGHHPKSGRTDDGPRLLEKTSPQLHRLHGESQNDVFFVGEVIVDGSFGVLHFRGDASHTECLKPLRDQNRTSDTEYLRSSLLHFTLFPGKFNHGVNYWRVVRKCKRNVDFFRRILEFRIYFG